MGLGNLRCRHLLLITCVWLIMAGCLLTSGAAAATNQLSVSVTTSAPAQGVPLTVSYGGESALTSFEGGSLEIYESTIAAYIRPAGGAPCQANSGSDEQVAGSADISISGEKVFGQPGPISDRGTATPPAPGAYVLCAWLEVVNGDGVITNKVLASTSTTFTVGTPQASLSIQAPTSAKLFAPFAIDYTTHTDQSLSLSVFVRPYDSTPCAGNDQLEVEAATANGSAENESAQQPVNGKSVFGGPTTGSTTVTESRAGQYLVCAWIEGPSAGEVDANASALVQVGKTSPAARSSSPELGRTGNVAPVSGQVTIRLPGTNTFVPLSGLSHIPFGSVIDATNGRVRVTTAGPHGGTQTGEFFGGEFVLRQKRNGLVVAELAGGSFAACPTARERGHTARMAATPASGKHAVRKLWTNAHGSFSTRGNYVIATVEGTEWLTEDLCEGTLVRVTRDKVAVTNLVNHRHVTVKAGHRYLAKAP